MNRMLSIDKPLLPLAFVGCWNREVIRAGHESPRDIVARSVRDANAQTVILGGDNIYAPSTWNDATKEEVKGNVYTVNSFRRGADLYTGVPQLFVAIGNHDVDGAGFDIFYEQQQAFGNSLPNNYYACDFSDGYSIVVIDTNLVEKDRETAFRNMLKWLTTTVSNGRPYFLIQHEPILAFSKMKGVAMKIAELKKAGNILDAIAAHPPIAILCADTHNYQHGTIQKAGGPQIPQYVVGTGGAMPDKMYNPEGAPFIAVEGGAKYTSGDITYTYDARRGPIDQENIRDPRTGYGYLSIRKSIASNVGRNIQRYEKRIFTLHNDLTFTFHHVLPWLRGGTRRAERKRRTKSRHRTRG